jgi:hypothetical protein
MGIDMLEGIAKAKAFYKEYLKLCEQYGVEIEPINGCEELIVGETKGRDSWRLDELEG